MTPGVKRVLWISGVALGAAAIVTVAVVASGSGAQQLGSVGSVDYRGVTITIERTCDDRASTGCFTASWTMQNAGPGWKNDTAKRTTTANTSDAALADAKLIVDRLLGAQP